MVVSGAKPQFFQLDPSVRGTLSDDILIYVNEKYLVEIFDDQKAHGQEHIQTAKRIIEFAIEKMEQVAQRVTLNNEVKEYLKEIYGKEIETKEDFVLFQLELLEYMTGIKLRQYEGSFTIKNIKNINFDLAEILSDMNEDNLQKDVLEFHRWPLFHKEK